MHSDPSTGQPPPTRPKAWRPALLISYDPPLLVDSVSETVFCAALQSIAPFTITVEASLFFKRFYQILCKSPDEALQYAETHTPLYPGMNPITVLVKHGLSTDSHAHISCETTQSAIKNEENRNGAEGLEEQPSAVPAQQQPVLQVVNKETQILKIQTASEALKSEEPSGSVKYPSNVPTPVNDFTITIPMLLVDSETLSAHASFRMDVLALLQAAKNRCFLAWERSRGLGFYRRLFKDDPESAAAHAEALLYYEEYAAAQQRYAGLLTVFPALAARNVARCRLIRGERGISEVVAADLSIAYGDIEGAYLLMVSQEGLPRHALSSWLVTQPLSRRKLLLAIYCYLNDLCHLDGCERDGQLQAATHQQLRASVLIKRTREIIASLNGGNTSLSPFWTDILQQFTIFKDKLCGDLNLEADISAPL